MKIVLIGSGNVATVIGRQIMRSNHMVTQVISRNKIHAKELADEMGAAYNDFTEPVHKDADIIIIAVSDSGIERLFSSIIKNDKLVVHTAGAVPMDVLKQYSKNYGVLYPLQTLRKEMPEVPEMPFLIDGSNPESLQVIGKFAYSISSNVKQANDEERLKLHAAAVIVSNFTNYLYSIAEDFCNQEHVDFNLLKPLIEETAHRIQNASPKNVQTGPAIRKDIKTLDKHLKLLNNYPKLKTTYLRLTDSIMNP
jgi:predicted short-subunit dehydrogenase-like oxidoreductase (DUF2520 family)